MTFSDLNLCAPVLKAVRNTGYENPTPIQQQAIPVVMEGRDIFGCAQTGTGKTAAFALPLIHRINGQGPQKGGPRVLVLAPTRELAAQIGDSFIQYGKMIHARYVTVFGGVSIGPQMHALRKGADVLVATPGRLIDLLEQRAVRLNNVETLVLDEADHMLDLGFLPQINRIVEALPKERQTLMFSATLPPSIKHLANNLLSDPVHLSVTPVSSAVDAVDQTLYHVNKDSKQDLLAYLLEEKLDGSVLVFTRTKRGADKVQKNLSVKGIASAAIHGEKSQAKRTQALKDFKSQRIRVLVATDVAARGIDINQLPYVINYDVTDTPETYVHRIGRTGRAGLTGNALMLASRDEIRQVRAIEKHLKRTIVVEHDHPYNEPVKGGAPRSEGRPQRSEGRPPRRSSGGSSRNGSGSSRNGSGSSRKGGGGFGRSNGNSSRSNSNSRTSYRGQR